MIDALPAAIYTTDADGRLTHFNPAAVELSGRTPKIGTDEWCVSWKLYRADGTPLPHDECPMAIALKEGRVTLGEEIIVERPDGTRLWCTPYPTPLRDATGKIVGRHQHARGHHRAKARRAETARQRAAVHAVHATSAGPGLDQGLRTDVMSTPMTRPRRPFRPAGPICTASPIRTSSRRRRPQQFREHDRKVAGRRLEHSDSRDADAPGRDRPSLHRQQVRHPELPTARAPWLAESPSTSPSSRRPRKRCVRARRRFARWRRPPRGSSGVSTLAGGLTYVNPQFARLLRPDVG